MKMRPPICILVTVCLVLLAAVSSNASVTVTRPVHVQNVTADSVLILWHTSEPTLGTVDFGPTLEYGFSTGEKLRSREHLIPLRRLQAGTLYYYRVRCDGDTLAAGSEFHIRTVPDKRASALRFLVWGDSGRGNADQYSLISAMQNAQPDFMIHVGDVMQEEGMAGEFDPFYFIPYQDLIRNTPVWPAMGNHDYRTNNGQPFLDAFFLPRNPSGSERYYSFTYGQAHFVVVDTNQAFDAAFLDWLHQDLASTTTTWKFAYMHHPMYSCGFHGSERGIRNTLAPLFQEHGVDIVFNGHDHDFQRSYPLWNRVLKNVDQNPDYRDPKGVIYINTGGGSTVRPTSAACDYTSVAFSRTHFTTIDIDANHLRLRAVDANNVVFDEMTITKNAGTLGAGAQPMRTQSAARLLDNVPNPFNPLTTLRYQLQTALPVELQIHDVAGRRVRQVSLGTGQPGSHRYLWDGRDSQGRAVASGVYIVHLVAGDSHSSQKIILAR